MYFLLPLKITQTFLIDEEIGGVDGMRKFVHTKEYEDLNVGFALDEGMASPNDEYALFYGERCIWRKNKEYYGDCLQFKFAIQKF